MRSTLALRRPARSSRVPAPTFLLVLLVLLSLLCSSVVAIRPHTRAYVVRRALPSASIAAAARSSALPLPVPHVMLAPATAGAAMEIVSRRSDAGLKAW